MNRPHNDAAVFPLLSEPDTYVACPWDLTTDSQRREYWLGVFREHFPTLVVKAKLHAEARGINQDTKLAEAQRQFDTFLDAVTQQPDAFGRLDVMAICWKREEILADLGIPDAYRLLKQQENEQALELLPALLEELDAMDESQRTARLIEGVFAGNIFDMGAKETQQMFEEGQIEFGDVRDKLKPRPWRYDALDPWNRRLARGTGKAALLFVDNAGPDIVLGMIPFARDLTERGMTVVLAANSEPALNDVTHLELNDLLDRIEQFDPVVRKHRAAGSLRVVESGNWAPLIDLSKVSPQLVEVCEQLPIDLVVLEGMGRSIESNFDVRLKVDTLWLAMVKDAGVAKSLDADMFDLVMRYREA